MIDLFIILLLLCTLLLFSSIQLYLLIIGLFTALLFAVDKIAAIRGASRIPEKVLLLACFLGGAPCALAAMILCHHKTEKPQFYIPVIIIVFVQAILFISI